MPESGHRALHSGYVAVVVGAPDVDNTLKTPLKLIPVVSNVRCEISRDSVCPTTTILFHTETGSFKPQGLLIRRSNLFFQVIQGLTSPSCRDCSENQTS